LTTQAHQAVTMDRSRSDVYQRTIDEQNHKIEKYQAKLRGHCLYVIKLFRRCCNSCIIMFMCMFLSLK